MFRIFQLEQNAKKAAIKRMAQVAKQEQEAQKAALLQHYAATHEKIGQRMKERERFIQQMKERELCTQSLFQKPKQQIALQEKLVELQRLLKQKIDSPWVLCEESRHDKSKIRVELSCQKPSNIQDLFMDIANKKLGLDVKKIEAIFLGILQKNYVVNAKKAADSSTFFVYFNKKDLDIITQKLTEAKDVTKTPLLRYASS